MGLQAQLSETLEIFSTAAALFSSLTDRFAPEGLEHPGGSGLRLAPAIAPFPASGL
jgi:hypothetical protein